jgi:hypothetical protein
MMTHVIRAASGSIIVLLLACSSSPTNGRPPAAGRETSQATVEQLEAEARTLARAEGCTSSGQCKAAPVGAKPCGGPRYYLPYCPLTTDEQALASKLEELKRAEEAYNRETGAFSTCEFVMPPRLELVDGACRAAPATVPME